MTAAEVAARVAYPDGEFTQPAVLAAFRKGFILGYESPDYVTADQALPQGEHTHAATLLVFHDAFDRGRAARRAAQ